MTDIDEVKREQVEMHAERSRRKQLENIGLPAIRKQLENMDLPAMKEQVAQIEEGIRRFTEPYERITELEAHNELLRAVANKAEWVKGALYSACSICDELQQDGHLDTCPYRAAIDGGALQNEAK